MAATEEEGPVHDPWTLTGCGGARVAGAVTLRRRIHCVIHEFKSDNWIQLKPPQLTREAAIIISQRMAYPWKLSIESLFVRL